MNRLALTVIAAVGLASPLALAQEKGDQPKAPADKAPSMTMEDMEKMQEACMVAATPGPMHELLVKGAGTWDGKVTMWMMPDMPPNESTCVSVITPIMDGRFIKVEVTGDMGPMGPFNGFGLYGYNNVTEKFESSWVDNMGTCIVSGAGKLGEDGKTLTWTSEFIDPFTKKPMTMREVDRHIDENTTVMEMYCPGPDGKEFKMMEIRSTRRADGASKPHAHGH